MTTELKRIKEIFNKIKETRIGIYGDFCLDSYWVLDPRGSEVSLETGLQALAVSSQNYSLGGGANVVANLAALKPKEIKTFGVYGDDVFGKEMISQLNTLNVNTGGMIMQNENFDTYTFSKLILDGKEQPRIDFGTYNKRSSETDKQILENIRNSINEVDIFIINQQVPGSITNIEFIDEFNKLIKDNPEKIFVIDSRHFADKFENVSYKVNNFEAANLSNYNYDDPEKISETELVEIAKKLNSQTNRPVFITRGENGILAYDETGLNEVEGIKLNAELDIVGAGDTVLSAITCALGAGCNIKETIELANLAAGVTVQKLYTTGTASENEILNLQCKVE
ncbi:MAG: PfkB family carbohydrate kinase [Melioribacteraceae bacterium]